jgi:hypothetical protein
MKSVVDALINILGILFVLVIVYSKDVVGLALIGIIFWFVAHPRGKTAPKWLKSLVVVALVVWLSAGR